MSATPAAAPDHSLDIERRAFRRRVLRRSAFAGFCLAVALPLAYIFYTVCWFLGIDMDDRSQSRRPLALLFCFVLAFGAFVIMTAPEGDWERGWRDIDGEDKAGLEAGRGKRRF